MCNEIKDSKGNTIARFDEKEKIFYILDFDNINSMKFINPDDEIAVEVQKIKRFKDRMTGKPKMSKKEYITRFIDLQTLPEEFQDKITEYDKRIFS